MTSSLRLLPRLRIAFVVIFLESWFPANVALAEGPSHHGGFPIQESPSQRIFCPYTGLRDFEDVSIVLLNKTRATIAASIYFYSDQENRSFELPIAVSGGGHSKLAAREAVRSAILRSVPGSKVDRDALIESMARGAIQIDYPGERSDLQAWLIVGNGEVEREIPFSGTSHLDSRQVDAFWDEPASSDSQVTIYAVNSGSENLDVTVASHTGENPNYVGVLSPGSTFAYEARSVNVSPGWLTVSYSGGAPGDLTAVGVVRDGSTKILTVASSGDSDTQLEALGIPLASHRPDRSRIPPTNLLIANRASNTIFATIDVRDAGGSILFSKRVELAANAVTSVTSLANGVVLAADAETTGPARISITATTPVFASGSLTMANGSQLPLVFASRIHAHASGSYPVLHDAVRNTTIPLLNVGAVRSVVGGQFYWRGGSYAWGPVTIEPEETALVDVDSIVRDAQPDLLGRTLPPNHDEAVFRWLVIKGSRAIMARAFFQTNHRPTGAGLFCFGCCYEYPALSILPSPQHFSVGQTPPFQSDVTYSTCDGTDGPYSTGYLTKTVPSPFTWTGSIVSASAASTTTVSFTDDVDEIAPGSYECQGREVEKTGNGTPDSCDTDLKKEGGGNWSPGTPCSLQVSRGDCTGCENCCNAVYDYKICEHINAGVALDDKNACLGHCITDVCQ